jgi:Fe-S cluster biogenesis protein NfuA
MLNIEEAIRPLRDALRQDGADIAFRLKREGVVYFDLQLGGAGCAECVMPREILEQVIFASLEGKVADLAAVRVKDPRAREGKE